MENVNSNLEKAESTFTLESGKKFEPAVLRKAVVDAGFTPRDIFIAAQGKLRDENGKLVFQPLGLEQVFTLAPNEQVEKLKAEELKEIGLEAKVVGEKPPLSLEVQKFHK